jgi:ATP-binding cassette subfamily F protein 3
MPTRATIGFPSAKWRMAYVAQETPALDRCALDYAIDGDATLRRLEAELAAPGSQPESHDNGIAIGELHARWPTPTATPCGARRSSCCSAWASRSRRSQPVASFSGGWRMRLNLAQALMCPSDLLLLDEPTNHLDLDAIVWLEDWLKRYPGTLVMISHDRDFLDAICNVIVHIDEQQAQALRRQLLRQFERLRAAADRAAAIGVREAAASVAHLESFINRFKAQGHQGAPGAEPREGAGKDGTNWRRCISPPSFRSNSASPTPRRIR